MDETAATKSKVIDLFSQEQYKGGNGLDNLDSKLRLIGMTEIDKMRNDCFNVSNFMFFLVIGTMVAFTLVSGAQSVVAGYMTGGESEVLAWLNAGRMALFQLCLLACGIVIGCWIGDTANKRVLAILCVLLGIPLMFVTIATGLAFAYFVQDSPGLSENTTPIKHFFTAVAANTSLFDSAESVQRAFNIYCVVVFECAVVITPILFKVLNAPVREKWETQKRVQAFNATERSKQTFIENIARTESDKVSADAKIYRKKRLTEMETRAKVMADMLDYEQTMIKMWMKRKGLWASLKYRVSGLHDTDDDFIRQVTNSDSAPREAISKKA